MIKDEASAQIVSRIELAPDILSEALSLHQGIRSKVGRDQIISRNPPLHDESWKKALVQSNQVIRYVIAYDGDFVHTDHSLLFAGGWDPIKIESPKILIRRTGDSIISAVDLEGFYHTNALIYGYSVREDVGVRSLLEFYCGILNSKLFTYYYRTVTAKEGRDFPQVEIDSLNELCVPHFDGSIEESREPTKVEQELNVLISQSDVKNGYMLINRIIQDGKLTLQNLLCLLVTLAQEYTKEIQDRRKIFLDWVKIATGSTLDNWEGRTLINNFTAISFEEFVEVFRLNETRSELKPMRRPSDLQLLRTNYENAVSEVAPLERSFLTVDAMINFVVYRMYGINESDIAIIEG